MVFASGFLGLALFNSFLVSCWRQNFNLHHQLSSEEFELPHRGLTLSYHPGGYKTHMYTHGWFMSVQFSSVSHVWLFATPWIAACQASLSITNTRSSLKLMSIELVMPSSHLILCHPLLSCPQSSPTSGSFPMSQHFTWGGQSTGDSALASFLPKKSQGWSPSDGLVGSPCSPRDSQESSPTPQFKSINSSTLSLLHSPTLTSIHDHRKSHSLD